jgi:hypothetical protein
MIRDARRRPPTPPSRAAPDPRAAAPGAAQAGLAVYSIEADAEVLYLLVKLHWIAEEELINKKAVEAALSEMVCASALLERLAEPEAASCASDARPDRRGRLSGKIIGSLRCDPIRLLFLLALLPRRRHHAIPPHDIIGLDFSLAGISDLQLRSLDRRSDVAV